ncbi:MAG: translesion DNA synthesis-associated protein ImuA [Steroidobacteraceae bacterium]
MSADGPRRTVPPSSAARTDPRLEQLLAHPALWRAGSAVRGAVWPSGFAPLDAGLPGGGWPRSGLIEILPMRFGQGELQLLLPTLASITRRPEARWCIWVAPPLQPFAPALAAAGVALPRLLIVRARRASSLWAFEQALGSGACDCVFAWTRHAPARHIRRLHLAAQRGNTLGVLFRTREAAREASPAMLRVALEPRGDGVRVTLLKSRGGARGALDLTWAADAHESQRMP